MPKYTKPRKTWQYTTECKVKAVQLSLIDGVQVKEVADTFDIHPFILSRWRKKYREGKIVADKRKTDGCDRCSAERNLESLQIRWLLQSLLVRFS